MTNDSLIYKINALPDSIKSEVEDFIDFLQSKTKAKPKLKIKARKFGFAKGKIKMAPDFDKPLDIFKEYMP